MKSCMIDGSTARYELKDFEGHVYYCQPGMASSFDVQLLEPETEFTGQSFDMGRVEISELGDQVFVCGYPDKLGDKPTISTGHISKLNAEYKNNSGLIQFSSAAVNRKNSGGPVTDYNGNVVGVLVMRTESGEKTLNVAFAEPLERALKELGIG